MIKKNILWATLNSGSGVLISLLASIYISRTIFPAYFLQLSIIFGIISLSNVLVDFGISSHILLSSSFDDSHIKYHERYIYQRSCVAFALYIIFALIFSKSITLPLPLLLISSIHFFSYPYNFYTNLYFNRYKLFREKLINSFLSTLLVSVVAIYFTFLGYPEIGYIISQVFSPLLLSIFLRLRLRINIIPPINFLYDFLSFTWLKILYSRRLSHSFGFHFFEMLSPLLSKSIMYLISPTILAPLYVKNDSFLIFPFKLIKKSISRVTIATLGPQESSSRSFLASLKKYLLLSLLSSIFVFTAVFIFGQNLIKATIGDMWILPANYYTYLSIFVSLKFLSTQLLNQLTILTKSFSNASQIYCYFLIASSFLSLALYVFGKLSFEVFVLILLISEFFKAFSALIAFVQNYRCCLASINDV